MIKFLQCDKFFCKRKANPNNVIVSLGQEFFVCDYHYKLDKNK